MNIQDVYAKMNMIFMGRVGQKIRESLLAAGRIIRLTFAKSRFVLCLGILLLVLCFELSLAGSLISGLRAYAAPWQLNSNNSIAWGDLYLTTPSAQGSWDSTGYYSNLFGTGVANNGAVLCGGEPSYEYHFAGLTTVDTSTHETCQRNQNGWWTWNHENPQYPYTSSADSTANGGGCGGLYTYNVSDAGYEDRRGASLNNKKAWRRFATSVSGLFDGYSEFRSDGNLDYWRKMPAYNCTLPGAHCGAPLAATVLNNTEAQAIYREKFDNTNCSGRVCYGISATDKYLHYNKNGDNSKQLIAGRRIQVKDDIKGTSLPVEPISYNGSRPIGINMYGHHYSDDTIATSNTLGRTDVGCEDASEGHQRLAGAGKDDPNYDDVFVFETYFNLADSWDIDYNNIHLLIDMAADNMIAIRLNGQDYYDMQNLGTHIAIPTGDTITDMNNGFLVPASSVGSSNYAPWNTMSDYTTTRLNSWKRGQNTLQFYVRSDYSHVMLLVRRLGLFIPINTHIVESGKSITGGTGEYNADGTKLKSLPQNSVQYNFTDVNSGPGVKWTGYNTSAICEWNGSTCATTTTPGLSFPNTTAFVSTSIGINQDNVGTEKCVHFNISSTSNFNPGQGSNSNSLCTRTPYQYHFVANSSSPQSSEGVSYGDDIKYRFGLSNASDSPTKSYNGVKAKIHYYLNSLQSDGSLSRIGNEISGPDVSVSDYLFPGSSISNTWTTINTSAFNGDSYQLKSGDEICAYIETNNRGIATGQGWDWGNDWYFRAGGSVRSNETCVRISRKPQMNIFGADSYGGDGFLGSSHTLKTSGDNRSFIGVRGSYAQYGLLTSGNDNSYTTSGKIYRFGSAGFVTSHNSAEACILMYANGNSNDLFDCIGNLKMDIGDQNSGDNKLGAARIERSIDDMMPPRKQISLNIANVLSRYGSNRKLSSSTLSNLPEGYYYYKPSSSSGKILTIGSSAENASSVFHPNDIVMSNNVTLYVDGSVIINDNITFGAPADSNKPYLKVTYKKVKEMPNLTIVATGNIYVSKNVSVLMGTYASKGRINTCSQSVSIDNNGNASDNHDSSGNPKLCELGNSQSIRSNKQGCDVCAENNLTVYGALISNYTPRFRRAYGGGKSIDNADVESNDGGLTPSESIRYTPNIWLMSAGDNDISNYRVEEMNYLPARL